MVTGSKADVDTVNGNDASLGVQRRSIGRLLEDRLQSWHLDDRLTGYKVDRCQERPTASP